MAKFGKKLLVNLDETKQYDDLKPALLDQGFEFRFCFTQKNGTKREIYVGPDGIAYALFDTSIDGRTYFCAEFKTFIAD